MPAFQAWHGPCRDCTTQAIWDVGYSCPLPLTLSQSRPIIATQSVYLQGGLVIAEVISVKTHPRADRLRVCSVDYGHDVAQVVTNAANVAEGMKVIFAVRTHGVAVEMGAVH